MFCSGLSSKLRKVIHDITPKIEEYANYALTLTGIIKEYVSGDLGTLIATATGSWGALTQQKVLDALEKAKTDLNIAVSETGKDLSTQLDDVAKMVLSTSAYQKNAVLIKLASRIVAHLDDDTKQEHFYDTVVQGAVLK